jgi:hypothetical protein
MTTYVKQSTEQYYELLTTLARYLPGYTITSKPTGWEQEPYDYFLTGAQGKQIHISRTSQDSRVFISGHYGDLHKHKAWAETYPRIGVTLKKTPEQIAKDIKRRFLPAYDELYAKLQEREVADKRREERRDNYNEILREVSGGIIGKENGYINGPLGYGKVWTSYDGRVKVELDNVPFPLAEKIAALLHPSSGQATKEMEAATGR